MVTFSIYTSLIPYWTILTQIFLRVRYFLERYNDFARSCGKVERTNKSEKVLSFVLQSELMVHPRKRNRI